MNSQILTNARIVTPESDFIGSAVIENGIITEIIKGKYYPEGTDQKGHWLIPGIIDIHTDYLEKEVNPRPSATFPLSFAMHYLDARTASCGITDVFCAISFSDDAMKGRSFSDAIQFVRNFQKLKPNLLIKRHLHARLDPNTDSVLEYLVDILCSDYHFPALLGSVIKMIASGISPSKAISYVTLNPAKMLNFNDVGSIETGKKLIL